MLRPQLKDMVLNQFLEAQSFVAKSKEQFMKDYQRKHSVDLVPAIEMKIESHKQGPQPRQVDI